MSTASTDAAGASAQTDGQETFGQFDFGLSAEDEARARRLHDEALIVDGLCWGPLGYRAITPEMDEEIRWAAKRWDHHPVDFFSFTLQQPLRWAARGRLPALRECFDASGVTVGTVDIITNGYERLAQTTRSAIAAFDALDWLSKATTRADVEAAKAAGGHAIIMRTQPTLSHARDLELIDASYDLGLRLCQLTYNWADFVGGGCLEDVIGLTDFGRKLVRHLNDRGVIVDVAHGGRQTMLDACEASDAPVICSHTTLNSVFEHGRAARDEQVEAIAATGGVVGIVAVPAFLSPDPVVDVNAFLDHVDRAVKVAGVEHVSIGTDWPNYGPKWMFEEMFAKFASSVGFREQDGFHKPAENLGGFDDYRDFPNITRGLVARGYDDAAVRGILGENFLRVLGEVCG